MNLSTKHQLQFSWLKAFWAFCFTLMTASAAAQSCPLCITNVEASKASFIAGLRDGIVVLVIAPLAICVLLGVTAYRRRNAFNDSAQSDPQFGHDTR